MLNNNFLIFYLLKFIRDQESSEEDEEENQEFMKGEQDLVLDGSLGAKLSKNEVFPVFPYYDIKRKFDVYGEIIKYNDL